MNDSDLILQIRSNIGINHISGAHAQSCPQTSVRINTIFFLALTTTWGHHVVLRWCGHELVHGPKNHCATIHRCAGNSYIASAISRSQNGEECNGYMNPAGVSKAGENKAPCIVLVESFQTNKKLPWTRLCDEARTITERLLTKLQLFPESVLMLGHNCKQIISGSIFVNQ